METRNKRHILLRYALVIVGVLLFSIAIIKKAADTCIIHADKWNEKAAQMLSVTHEVMPERGDILAQNGEVMATNMTYYRALIDFGVPKFKAREFNDSVKILSQMLAKYFPNKTAAAYEKGMRSAFLRKKRYYVLVREVTGHDYELLKTFPFLRYSTPYSGFYIDPNREKIIKREKPYGTMASRAIGGLDETFHGNSGLEKALDSLLYGIPGRTIKKQIPSGIVDWVSDPPQRGLDVKTTIDIDIQDITEQALLQTIEETQPEFAVAIVMEVATGEIKAMSNLSRLPGGEYLETVNNAVQGYEPGSVVKPLSMMIALDDGVVRPNDVINGHNGVFRYPAGARVRPITDTHGRASMTAIEAMKYSSNIGLSEIILRGYERDPDRFVQRIYEVGFMEPFDLGIPGTARPTIRHLKATVQDRINLTRMSYGYTTKIPPIYTLALYNTIANDGKFVKPRLVKELLRNGKPEKVFDISYIREHACKPETARALRQMLYAVVNDDDGTGRLARSKKVTIAGKTGTVRTIGADGKYESRYRITFCGFFPYEKPQYSCIVLLGKPDLPGMPSAGRYCGGVLKKIAETLYSMGRLDVPMAMPSDSTQTFAPSIMKGDIAETRQVLQRLGVRGDVSDCYNIETYCDSMPDVSGMGARDALYLLEQAGLNVSIQGRGRVYEQSIPRGAALQPGTTVILKLK
ncbi:penicillin-binding protein [Barnesiella viscericola]|uniref:penicillin-binding protein n=1 Tax=Barnesiella viscericola TaxID=397865 RepID=UPI002355835F|nr:penicillin-binding protein [Barnesiella viscericola]